MKGKGSIKFEWERTADTSAFLSLSHTVHSSPFTPSCTKVIIPGDVNGWMDGWQKCPALTSSRPSFSQVGLKKTDQPGAVLS